MAVEKKKYIIELDDNTLAYTAILIDGVPYIKPLQLLPYTEPDMEQVRKEAYEEGYENGFVAGHLKAEKSGQSFYEDGYQRGLNDANRDGEYNADDGWYVMQKISLLPNPIKTELFGTAETAVILQDNSFKDALAKLTEYEQEQEEQIQVGDEVVKDGDEKYIVLQKYLNDIDELMLVLFHTRDGEIDKWYLNNANGTIFEKTGRHFPQIAEVLQKMKGKN